MLESAKEIIKKLNDNGYEAYIVGGYVRDYLLNSASNDIDITTSAAPSVTQSLFDTYPTGIKYGTVTVKFNGYFFEVTTYRSDLEYLDNRHPIINFGTNLEGDLARRDFTINGMTLDYNGEITDLFDGKGDLNKKLIKAIGDPDKRFKEDALRMLRAVYFSAKLGFTIENKTLDAISLNAALIKNVSIERIYQEIKKIMNCKKQNIAFKYLDETGLSNYLPGLQKGIRFLKDVENPVTLDEFFTLCFKLNEVTLEDWKFSSNDFLKYSKASDLAVATEDGNFTSILMYTYSLPICLLANKVNVILGLTKDLTDMLNKLDQDLPIHKTCDLVFKGQDIMQISTRKAASWLGELVDEIKYLVINKSMKNDYEEIKNYVVKRLKEERCYREE